MQEATAAAIAVIVPCHNEEATVAKVVADFRRALPQAAVWVFDNASTDATVERARAAGACVAQVPLKGKGQVVRRMFADVDADVYVLVDGDDTYPAAAAPAMVDALLERRLDMLVARRVEAPDAAYRRGHRFGNWLLTSCVRTLFASGFTDMLSGYRVFSRRYAKTFPSDAVGFEIETELTVHALELHMPVDELEVPYRARPEGSASKLSTWRDGWRILMTIVRLMKSERPQAFFGVGALACLLVSGVLAVPIFRTYLATGLVPRFPTAFLCASLVLLGAILLACGLILDTVTRGRVETKRLAYLAQPAPGTRARRA
jgi:glycosyltransferase involved in cell wall biosynthesis